MRRIVLAMLAALIFMSFGCVHKNSLGKIEQLSTLPVNHVQVADRTVGYRVFGKGKPLLMIMGFAGTMDIWDPQFIGELARERRVILFDNRGTGDSEFGDGPLSIRGMAEDSAAVLDALGIERADVLGWSMGGLIAQELMLNNPQKVDKLILMGTSCDPEPVADITRRLLEMDKEELKRHIFPLCWLKTDHNPFEDLPKMGKPVPLETVKAQADAMLNWDGSCSRIKEVDSPVLIISGTDDDILPEKLSVELAQNVRGAWLVRYKDAAHWLMYQNQQELGRVVNVFLSVDQDLCP